MVGPGRSGADDRVYETPSSDEFAARHGSVRAMLDEAGLDGLLVYGNLAAGHPIRYLTGWPPGWDSYVVLPRDGGPILLVPSPNHVPTAVAMAAEGVDVRWVGPDPGAGLAEALEAVARDVDGGRLGVVGPLPYARHAGVAADGRLRLESADRQFQRLRLVKRPEEIERTRRAARLADLAVEALLAEARPGLREYELGAIIQSAYRREGGEDGICFLATASPSTGGAVVPAQVWSGRRVAAGDLIMFELSVGVGGDSSQVLRTISLGRPDLATRALHDVADEAFEAIVASVRPGAEVDALLQAAAVIDAAGWTVVDDVVHGYGGGYLPPVLRTPATQVRPPEPLRLEPGMMLVVQPNVVDTGRAVGVQTGELVVVTDDGAERFHAIPTGLQVV
jgi:Xaa-Pro aminopeptidase